MNYGYMYPATKENYIKLVEAGLEFEYTQNDHIIMVENTEGKWLVLNNYNKIKEDGTLDYLKQNHGQSVLWYRGVKECKEEIDKHTFPYFEK